MSRWMRLVCLCLMVLALPLQGVAALAWRHGLPAPVGAAGVAAIATSDVAEGACHAHADPMAGHAPHHFGNRHPDSADSPTGDTQTAQTGGHAGCSACAACCGHGTAPPLASWAAPGSAPLSAAPALGPVAVVAPWTTEGIERPPRG